MSSRISNRYRCLLQGRVPRGAPSKEIARVILDREDRKRDLFALGGSKVFMREELEKKLEKERQDIMEVEVLKVQRIVRGYLARKQYKTMKRNAIRIQAAFRGYQVRKQYSKMRRGIVALQAVYR
jgi:myosin X